MKADQAILDRLDAPTNAPNWPVGAEGQFLCLLLRFTMYGWFIACYFFTSGFLALFLFLDLEKLPRICISLIKRTRVTERKVHIR